MEIKPDKIINLKQDHASPKLGIEVTRADVPLYEKYQERPFNPDLLYRKKGNYDIFDDMREDDQIAAIFQLKKLIILDSKWEIETDNDDVRDFLIKALNDIPGGLSKKLYDVLSALDYGFSLTEKLWKLNEDGKIVIKDLKTRPPHGWRIEQDDLGNITDFIQETGIGDNPVPAGKLIHYINEKEFDNPYGKSDLNKGVYTLFWSKLHMQKYWNIMMERFGMPTAVGVYSKEHQGQKDELLKALKGMQAATAITMPEGVTATLLEPESDKIGEGFKLAIDYFNTAIARKMMVPDLVGFSGGETGGGSPTDCRSHLSGWADLVDEFLISPGLVL